MGPATVPTSGLVVNNIPKFPPNILHSRNGREWGVHIHDLNRCFQNALPQNSSRVYTIQQLSLPSRKVISDKTTECLKDQWKVKCSEEFPVNLSIRSSDSKRETLPKLMKTQGESLSISSILQCIYKRYWKIWRAVRKRNRVKDWKVVKERNCWILDSKESLFSKSKCSMNVKAKARWIKMRNKPWFF